MLGEDIYDYYQVKSLMHKINPLTKIFCLLFFILIFCFSNNLIVVIATVLSFLIQLLISKIPIKLYFKLFSRIFICLLLFLTILFLFKITILDSFVFIVKILLVYLYYWFIVHSSKVFDIVKEIINLLALFKVKVNKLKKFKWKLLIFIKYPFLFNRNVNKIYLSLSTRGESIYNYSLFGRGMIILRSLRRINKLVLHDKNILMDNYKQKGFGSVVIEKIKFNCFDNVLIIMHVLIWILIFKEIWI